MGTHVHDGDNTGIGPITIPNDVAITSGSLITANLESPDGQDMTIQLGNGTASIPGGSSFNAAAGNAYAGSNNPGGTVNWAGGIGDGSGVGGDSYLQGGTGGSTGNGGNAYMRAGTKGAGGSSNGYAGFQDADDPNKIAAFNASSLSTKRTFTFPNSDGTLALTVTTPTISSGTGVPGSTPTKVGDIYVDTTNKKLYFATGISSSADWTIAN